VLIVLSRNVEYKAADIANQDAWYIDASRDETMTQVTPSDPTQSLAVVLHSNPS
jgi:hypothetical protein